MNVGQKIANRRKELGLTLEQVGDYVGVGKSTVKKWETGYIANMRRDKIALLAKVLKMEPTEFISDETDSPEPNEPPNSSPEPTIDTTAPTIENYINNFKSPAEQKAVREIIETLPQLSLSGLYRIYQYAVDTKFVPDCMKEDLKPREDGLTMIAARDGETKPVELKKRKGAGSLFDLPGYKNGGFR